MKVTTRDLFNYVNPACKYQTFLNREGLEDGQLPETFSIYKDILFIKQQGMLAGEQVKHTRFQDEVDCG